MSDKPGYYYQMLLDKELKLLNLALSKAKRDGTYRYWAKFIRTKQENITWFLRLVEGHAPILFHKRGDTRYVFN